MRFLALSGVSVLALAGCETGSALDDMMTERAAPERVETFVEIVSASDCALTEAEAEVILPANGFDKPEVELIVTELGLTGRARVENETLVLSDGECI